MKIKLFTVFILSLVLLSFASAIKKADLKSFDQLVRQMSRYAQFCTAEKLYLQFDRSLYQPGETIWFSAFIRNANTFKAEETSGILYVELLDGKGKVIQKLELVLHEGNGGGSFTLAKNLAGGLYKINAYTNWNKNFDSFFTRELMIQKPVLPQLDLQLEFEKEAYGPSDLVTAIFEVKDLEASPLQEQMLDFQVQLDGEAIHRNKAKTTGKGEAILSFRLPPTLNSTDGRLNVIIPFRGKKESISKAIPIVLNKIDVQFLPEGGHLISSLPGTIAFKAINEFGDPADISGEILDDRGKKIVDFTSFHDGMGTFDFQPKEGKSYFARITKPLGITDTFRLPLAQKSGAIIQVKKLAENQIKGVVHSNTKEPLDLILQSGDQIVYHKSLPKKSQNTFLIPTADLPIGISRLSLFNAQKHILSERLVFLNKDRQLSIEIKPDKRNYLPREQVKLQISVKDRENNPVKGAFSLAVVDEKLLSYADDKQGHILSSLLLESELKGTIHEPNFYFDKKEDKAEKALDLLMLTHGWRKYEWEKVRSPNLKASSYEKEKAHIAGSVKTVSGVPVATAKVHLIGTNTTCMTDSLGRFELKNIDLPRQGMVLKVEKADQPTVRRRINRYDNALEIVMAKGYGWLEGKVLGLTESSAEKIELELKQKGQNISRLVLEDQNSFQFPQLLPGIYQLEGKKEGKRMALFEDIEIEANLVSRKNIAFLPTPEKQHKAKSLENELAFDFKQLQVVEELITEEEFMVVEQQLMAASLSDVVVVAYQVPLIEMDNTSVAKVITSEDIRQLPVRNINALVSQVAGLSSADEGDPISIRGSRPNATEYYIDGIQVAGEMVPAVDVSRLDVLTGGVPAKFGGGTTSLPTLRQERNLKFEAFNGAELEIPAKTRGGNSDVLIGNSGAPRGSYRQNSIGRVYQNVDKPARGIFQVCETLKNKKEKAACATHQLEEVLLDKLVTSQSQWMNTNGQLNLRFVVDKKGKAKRFESFKVSNSKLNYLRWGVQQILSNQINWIPGSKKAGKVSSYYDLQLDVEAIGAFERNQYAQKKQFYSPKYAAKSSIRQRSDFRSTIFWSDEVKTDEKGQANISFWNCDDLTNYRITMEGLSANGDIGRTEASYFTQMPFSITTKLPPAVLTGDEISIPITLSNNSEKNIEGALSLLVPDAFEACHTLPKAIQIPAKGYKTLYLDYCVKPVIKEELKKEKSAIQIRFEGGNIVENLRQNIAIINRGFPVETIFSGMEMENKFVCSIDNMLPGTLTGKLLAHPNPVSETISSVDRMFRQPHGCFEQTSSTTYPNILALRLINQIKPGGSALKQKAKEYIAKGYERLVGYEVPGGGFDWFGKKPAHEGLTAYGLMEFVDMKKVYPVSQQLIDRTSKWLLSRKDGEGGWARSGRGLHSWGSKNEIWDAYIVWAICEAGYGDAIAKEIEKTVRDASKSSDPYIIALAANALLLRGDNRAKGLLNKLLQMQKENGSWRGLSGSITQSRGRNLTVETTALALLALEKEGPQFDKALKNGIQFLAKSKTPYGFGSTQATVLALKAINQYYSGNKSKTSTEGSIELLIDGQSVRKKRFNPSQLHPVILSDFTDQLKNGSSTIEVVFQQTKEAIPFELEIFYAADRKKGAPACALSLETHLSAKNTALGEVVRYTATVSNKTNLVLGYTTAELGIPAGLSVQIHQLKDLKEKGSIHHFELFEGRLVLHLLNLGASAQWHIPLDLKADIPGVYTAPASKAYLYYENDKVHWADPVEVHISP